MNRRGMMGVLCLVVGVGLVGYAGCLLLIPPEEEVSEVRRARPRELTVEREGSATEATSLKPAPFVTEHAAEKAPLPPGMGELIVLAVDAKGQPRPLTWLVDWSASCGATHRSAGVATMTQGRLQLVMPRDVDVLSLEPYPVHGIPRGPKTHLKFSKWPGEIAWDTSAVPTMITARVTSEVGSITSFEIALSGAGYSGGSGEGLVEMGTEWHLGIPRAAVKFLEFRSARRLTPLFGSVRVDIPRGEGDVDLGTITLPKLVVLAKGRFLDAQGAPAPRMLVSVRPLAEEERGVEVPCPVDTDGLGRFLFVLAEQPRARRWAITARHRDGRRLAYAEFDVGTTDLELRLLPQGSLTGSIVVTAPMPRFRVRAYHGESGWVTSTLDMFSELPANGRFLLHDIPAGVVDLHIECEGGQNLVIAGISVLAGQMNRDGRIERLELVRTRSLEVCVRDAEGRPLADAFVLVRMPGPKGEWQNEEQATDGTGLAKFSSLSSDTGEVVVEQGRAVGRALYRGEARIDVQLVQLVAVKLQLPEVMAQQEVPARSSLKVRLRPISATSRGRRNDVILDQWSEGVVTCDLLPGPYTVHFDEGEGEAAGRIQVPSTGGTVVLPPPK